MFTFTTFTYLPAFTLNNTNPIGQNDNMTDDYPTIEEIERAIAKEKPKCMCGAILPPNIKDEVWLDGHAGGVNVEGLDKPRWLYVTCENCGYDFFVGQMRDIHYLWE